jgi:iron complex outermembrane recepter protein
MHSLKAAVVGSATAVFCTLILLSTAYARAEEPAPQPFDIGPQTLASALTEFARQSKQEILFAPSIVSHKVSGGVRGTMGATVALKILLKDSGLNFTSTQSGAILVGAPGAATTQSSDQQENVKEGKTSSSDRFLLAQATQGQAASTTAVSNQTPSPEPRLEEVIVTANKRAENLQNVGSGVSVVTAARLDQLQANSLADYLQEVPGVALQSYGAPGYGVVEIRGISPQSVGATVATYVDNIPVSPSGAVGEGANYQPDLDPADIERVEVLKGPQGTLYGASSMGGVIKYVTKQPSFTQTDVSLTEEAEFVDHGEFGGKVRASYSTPLADDVAVRVSGYYRWIPGWMDDVGVSGENANHGYDWGGRATLLWKPTSDLTVNLGAMEQQLRQDAYNSVDLDSNTFKPLYGPLAQLRYVPEFMEYRTDLYSLEVNYEQPYGSFLSASSFSSVHPTQNLDATTSFEGFPNGTSTLGPSNPVGYRGHHYSEQETEELRFTSTRVGNFEYLVGAFYQHELADDGAQFTEYETGLVPDTVDPPLGGFERTGSLWEAAGFFDVTYYLLPTLDFTLGYRYSDIGQHRLSSIYGPIYEGSTPGEFESDNIKTTQSSKTYLGDVRWHITDDFMAYARAASGYRPGGVRSPLPGAPPDFSLQYTSDNIWSYETGAKGTWLDGKLTVDTDVYWINWDNIQALVYIGIFNTDGNGGHALSRGAEMQTTYAPVGGLTLRANLAYTDAYFKDTDPSVDVTAGQRLYLVPKWQGSLSADYKWSVGRYVADVGADWSYTGVQYDITNFPLRSYALANVRAGLTWNTCSFNLFVKNVADKRAIVGDTGYFQGFNPYDVTLAQPLTIGISFTQRF